MRFVLFLDFVSEEGKLSSFAAFKECLQYNGQKALLYLPNKEQAFISRICYQDHRHQNSWKSKTQLYCKTT
jgi:hypothetical protein